MSTDIITFAQGRNDRADVPTELRHLAGILAWRRHGAEAVVPVFAQIEPPAAFDPNFALMQIPRFAD